MTEVFLRIYAGKTRKLMSKMYFFSRKKNKEFLTFFIIDFDGYFIVRTDEGQPRPKYIFNNSINVELTSPFYSTEVWSITITEF